MYVLLYAFLEFLDMHAFYVRLITLNILFILPIPVLDSNILYFVMHVCYIFITSRWEFPASLRHIEIYFAVSQLFL